MNIFETMASRRALREAEINGDVADSLDVRKALLERVRKGELTLAQAQAQLAKIQREASTSGKRTRASGCPQE